METLIPFAFIAAGLFSLFLGRRLFWLFVGIGGFVLGLLLGQVIGQEWGAGGQLLAGLVLGAGCAVLSIYVQKPMAALAAFFGGGLVIVLLYSTLRYGVNSLPLLLSGQTGSEVALIFVVSGLLFAILIWLIFEKALIGLSALVGAALVMVGVLPFLPSTLPPLAVPFSTLGLTALGIWVQARR